MLLLLFVIAKKRKSARKTKTNETSAMVILAPPGFACRDVKADGNRTFRAISRSILGSSDRRAEVRRQVVKDMEEEGRREEFKALCVRHEDMPPNRASNAGDAHFRSYVKKAGKPSTWGDELCLLAASMSYKRAIKVWNSRARRDSGTSAASGQARAAECALREIRGRTQNATWRLNEIRRKRRARLVAARNPESPRLATGKRNQRRRREKERCAAPGKRTTGTC